MALTAEDLNNIGRLFSGFATKSDMEAFPTKADLKKELTGFATKADLTGFATKADLKNELTGFTTKADLTAFATKADLKLFATKDDLKGFATKDDLREFATKDDLAKLPTRDDLKGFATKDDLIDGLSGLRSEMHDGFENILDTLNEHIIDTDRRFMSDRKRLERLEKIVL